MLDYIRGAVILGCGGGGVAESGKEQVDYAFEKGLKFNLKDISEYKDDEMMCIISGVGGGVSPEIKKKVEPYQNKAPVSREARHERLLKTIEVLESYIGKKFSSCVPSETGGGNGVMPMLLNALKGNPSVDGDGCGRAKPEICISLTHVSGIPIAPISVVTPFLESVIIKSAVDDYRGEDMTRYLAVASGGGVTAARSSAPVKNFKKSIAVGQVTRCQKIGAAIRKATESGSDPVEAFIKTTDAYKLFEGKVTEYEFEGRGGFNWGNWHIKGSGKYNGETLKVWYKNENLVSWLNEKPYVVSPDLICIVDSKTCDGLSNFSTAGNDKRDVTVLGVKAIDAWRSAKGIEIFGPQHFGFDLDYTPLEEIVKKR